MVFKQLVSNSEAVAPDGSGDLPKVLFDKGIQRKKEKVNDNF